jgi:hypothetical protein
MFSNAMKRQSDLYINNKYLKMGEIFYDYATKKFISLPVIKHKLAGLEVKYDKSFNDFCYGLDEKELINVDKIPSRPPISPDAIPPTTLIMAEAALWYNNDHLTSESKIYDRKYNAHMNVDTCDFYFLFNYNVKNLRIRKYESCTKTFFVSSIQSRLERFVELAEHEMPPIYLRNINDIIVDISMYDFNDDVKVICSMYCTGILGVLHFDSILSEVQLTMFQLDEIIDMIHTATNPICCIQRAIMFTYNLKVQPRHEIYLWALLTHGKDCENYAVRDVEYLNFMSSRPFVMIIGGRDLNFTKSDKELYCAKNTQHNRIDTLELMALTVWLDRLRLNFAKYLDELILEYAQYTIQKQPTQQQLTKLRLTPLVDSEPHLFPKNIYAQACQYAKQPYILQDYNNDKTKPVISTMGMPASLKELYSLEPERFIHLYPDDDTEHERFTLQPRWYACVPRQPTVQIHGIKIRLPQFKDANDKII